MKKVIVVGGGAAGMMAAIFASKNNDVILFERNEKLGKKLFITGKGRCNVTNAKDTNEFFDEVVSNPKFLYSSIYGFDANMVMDFFKENGLMLKIERGDRVFPESDHSSDVIRTLEKILNGSNVKVIKNSYVNDILVENGAVKGVICDEKKYFADKVILATGGYSYPVTGSDGNFRKVLEKYGHSFVPPKPGLVPFEAEDSFCENLQGLSLKNISLKLMCKGKEVYNGFGEMLFTHFGISGPLVLSASSYYSKKMYGEKCLAYIDFKPALSIEKLDKRVLRDFDERKNKHLKNALDGLLPSKLIPVIIEKSKIDPEKSVNEITKEERLRLVNLLKNFEIRINGVRDFKEAIITVGGVNVKEINPSSMESKIIKNLYFAGEMIDVDALTGGFNLQIAWSTGKLAGECI